MEVENLHIKITTDAGNAGQDIAGATKELEKLDTQSTTTAADLTQLETSLGRIASVTGQFVDSISASVSELSEFNGKFESAAWSVSWLGSSSETTAAALSGVTAAADGFGDKMSILQGATDGTASGMGELQKQLTDTLSSIRGFSDNMSTAGQDAEAASKKIRELAEDIDKVKNSSSAGQQSVLGLAGGFKQLKGIVATLGVGAFIKSSNDAYNVQMQNELKLTSHMKHRMNATDEQIQSVKELASAQQRLGIIGDEIQLAGAQQLTTYARNASTLQTLIPAMNNLIAQNAGFEASTGDATSAADKLGRALNGQYTALQREGVYFSEAQENILKYGTEEQKAAVLAEAINEKVGNMNELLANTPTGKLKQLQNDFGDLQEQLGATWQPLISAVVPIASELLQMLAPPIKTISTGITTIGQAIASIDSPAVRAIALAGAAFAIVRHLQIALGGTSAGLLLLGTVLSFVVGSLSQNEETVGNIVTNAYNSAADAAGSATDAAEDYNKQLGEVEKTANRLAGFDTLTKLSGGGKGSLIGSLFDKEAFEKAKDALGAAADIGADFSNMSFDPPSINWDKLLDEAIVTGNDLWNGFFGKDDETKYAALTRLSEKVKAIFGTEFVDTFRQVGVDIYDIINGDDKSVYQGWLDLDTKLGTLFGSFYTDKVSPYFQKIGADINKTITKASEGFSSLGTGIDLLMKGDTEGAQEAFSKGLADTLGAANDVGQGWASIAKWMPGVRGLGWAYDSLIGPMGDDIEDILNGNIPDVNKFKDLEAVNHFSPIQGATEEAYYKWGTMGMPTNTPVDKINSMGTKRTTDPKLDRHYGGMPSNVPDVYITVNVDGQEADTIITNGGGS